MRDSSKGLENENHWALHGDTYMKGAWVMHTLRSVIDNDKIWFEILREFMHENAKGFANTRDFFEKVNAVSYTHLTLPTILPV